LALPPEIVQESPQKVFDQYWRTRECTSADARTLQRASLAAGMLRKREGRLLDIGCGRGLASAFFAQLGYEVSGIDVSPLSVKWTGERGIRAALVDLDTEPIEGQYDIIVCLETLQYLRDPVAALHKMRRALALGGEIIVSLPCEYHLVRRLSILLLGKGPGGIDFPLTIFNPAEHRRLFARVGLRVTDMRPVSLVPPRWRFLRGPGQLLAAISPSLFALSVLYRLGERAK